MLLYCMIHFAPFMSLHICNNANTFGLGKPPQKMLHSQEQFQYGKIYIFKYF